MAREYDIAKASEQCGRCGRVLAAGEEFVAALIDGGEELRREDYCGPCWEARSAEGGGECFSIWRCRVPEPEKPRRQLVGNAALMELFDKLEAAVEPAKLNFRFVLGLMLMRKKLLIYDRSCRDADGGEVWTMHWKGQDAPLRVVNPQLDDQKIAQVAEQLGAIFEVPT